MNLLFLESEAVRQNTLAWGFSSLGHKIKYSGPLTEEILRDQIDKFMPDLVFTIGWGPETAWEYKQNWIRKYVNGAGIPHVYWGTEDPTHTYTFSLPYIRRVLPDFIFTICQNRVDFYKEMGFSAAHMDFGYNPSIQFPTEKIEQYNCSIAIVANGYPHVLKDYPEHYRNKSLQILIRPLLEKNIRIDFWGESWELMSPFLGCSIPNEWIHGVLPYTETNKVYNSADIIIALQNNPYQLTQRIYEILGSGGFVLTTDTPEVRRLFNPGLELAVSSSSEETISLIQYYLNNPGLIKRIGEQGRIAVQRHNYKNRAEYVMNILKENRIVLQSENIVNAKTSIKQSLINTFSRFKHFITTN